MGLGLGTGQECAYIRKNTDRNNTNIRSFRNLQTTQRQSIIMVSLCSGEVINL